MIHVNRLPALVRQHIAALRALLVFTVLCGIVYPVVMFGVAQVAFHNQANGSLVSYNGKVVGSGLLCQEFVDAKGNPLPQYFQPRPSNAANAASKTDYGCDAGFSGATNLASGSGLDPDISPQYAYLQVNRVAKARHLSPSAVHALVAANVQGRPLGFLGEPTVDVLVLNIALDKLSSR